MSTGSEGQYSPKLVTLTIGTPTNSLLGDITIPGLPQGLSFPAVCTGYAPDSFITVTATTDSVTMVAGVEGNVQHVHNHDASGTIAVSVQQNTQLCRLLTVSFGRVLIVGHRASRSFLMELANERIKPEADTVLYVFRPDRFMA